VGRKTKDSGRDGLLVVDKPTGITSHDAVARLRRIVGQPRCGHSGTLDPDATGVLLVGFGRVTKLLPYLTVLGKRYVGDMVLGTETSTLDAAGDVLATYDMTAVTLADVVTAAAKFVGPIEQIPPMVSAVHVDGKRLHEYAREGIEVERPVRHVTIHELTVIGEVEPGVFRLDVSCSSGTYIRTLAADIGTALGGGAHLRNLRRTAVGPFGVNEAVTFDSLAQVATPDDLVLLSAAEAFRGRPMVQVSVEIAAGFLQGKMVRRADVGIAATDDGPWGAIAPDGTMAAVLEAFRETGLLKPSVVLARQ
jgi:tRNA pseudouridine55 synthase